MQAHYPEYDRHNLHKDRLYVMASDNFVSELSIFRYSSTMRDIFEKIERVEDQAFKEFNNEKGFVKVNSMKIVLDAQKLKSDILSGKALDVSVEQLGKKMRQVLEKNEQLNQQLEDKS